MEQKIITINANSYIKAVVDVLDSLKGIEGTDEAIGILNVIKISLDDEDKCSKGYEEIG